MEAREAAPFAWSAHVQDRTSVFPDYAPAWASGEEENGLAAQAGASFAGVVGALVTLAVAAGMAFGVRKGRGTP